MLCGSEDATLRRQDQRCTAPPPSAAAAPPPHAPPPCSWRRISVNMMFQNYMVNHQTAVLSQQVAIGALGHNQGCALAGRAVTGDVHQNGGARHVLMRAYQCGWPWRDGSRAAPVIRYSAQWAGLALQENLGACSWSGSGPPQACSCAYQTPWTSTSQTSSGLAPMSAWDQVAVRCAPYRAREMRGAARHSMARRSAARQQSRCSPSAALAARGGAASRPAHHRRTAGKSGTRPPPRPSPRPTAGQGGGARETSNASCGGESGRHRGHAYPLVLRVRAYAHARALAAPVAGAARGGPGTGG